MLCQYQFANMEYLEKFNYCILSHAKKRSTCYSHILRFSFTWQRPIFPQAVLSALEVLTSVFEMGTGGTPPV